MINKKSFIFVTGHKGLVGSAVIRRLKFYGYNNEELKKFGNYIEKFESIKL